MRLDRYICKQLNCSRSDVRLIISKGFVEVDGEIVLSNNHTVTQFSKVICDGKILLSKSAYYIMLHKPAGYVSATVDDEHPTALDLIKESYAEQLHIAGRLDKASTGLLILTNDGTWSRYLTEPIMAIPKRYLVTTERPIESWYIEKFDQGFYFAFENITTLPAKLEIVSEQSAIVTIYEGKYHQIKRMFHAVENRITSLHRLSIGCLELDEALNPGEYRNLTDREIAATKK